MPPTSTASTVASGSKGGRAGRPLAPATIRRAHGILHRALVQGVMGMAERQPGVVGDATTYPDARHHPAGAPRPGPAVRVLATKIDVDLADLSC